MLARSLVATSARRRPLRFLAKTNAAPTALTVKIHWVHSVAPLERNGSHMAQWDAAATTKGGKYRHQQQQRRHYLPNATPQRQPKHSRNEQKKKEQQSKSNSLSLSDIKQQVKDVQQQQLSPLQPLSLPLLDWSLYGDLQERHNLFVTTTEILDALEQSVQQGTINPAGKHGREVSAIGAMLLNFYSASHANTSEHLHLPTKDTSKSNETVSLSTLNRRRGTSDTKSNDNSAFDQCQRLLRLLDQWNLSRHHAHYHYALLAAVHEERWKEASELYRQQIDSDVSGFSPVPVSVASPVGLYATARAAQRSGSSVGSSESTKASVGVVEPVMNAVINHLSLISPSDQDKYVLAAGTALGLAGEAEALVKYLQSSYNASSLGQSLVAATMHACNLCGRPDEAFRVYRTLLDGNLAISSEFHWGGGQHQVLPLCRDLAMRALGDAELTGGSSEALALLRQTLSDELAISGEALLGVLGACEYDTNWQGAIDVLFLLLDDRNETLRFVAGSEMHIADALSMPGATGGDTCLLDRGKIVSSVMRTCNGAQNHGLAILSYLLVDSAAPESALAWPKKSAELAGDLADNGCMENSLLPLLAGEDYSPELLSVLMLSLCRAECYSEAQALFDTTKTKVRNQGEAGLVWGDIYADAEEICQYSQSSAVTSSHNEYRWDSAHRHIHRVIKSLLLLKTQGDSLTAEQLSTISFAVAAALRSCTFAGQPAASVVFAEYVKMEVSRLVAQSSETGSLFRDPDTDVFDPDVLLSDSLLSEEMKAYHATNQAELAMDLFKEKVENSKDNLLQWTSSCNVAMNILAKQGKLDDATALYHRLVDSSEGNRVSESMLVAAENYARTKNWNGVGDVYHAAVEKDLLSEKLGLLAMKAIVELEMPGTLRNLREIVNDVSLSSGSNPMVWLEDHYWNLKFELGSKYSRLLMWWNDPHSFHLDELQFAIEVFEKKLEEGLKPKNQAVKVIVTQARYFHDGYIPDGKPGIARVPRDRDSWAELIRRVLEESESLENNAAFIDEAAMALKNLGCAEECFFFVEAALHRGVRVNRVALETALEGATAAGIEDRTSGIRLMLT